MGYLNLKRRVGAWCLPARARERSVNLEPREGRQGPGGDRSAGESLYSYRRGSWFPSKDGRLNLCATDRVASIDVHT